MTEATRKELLALLKQEADKLMCETHPEVCALRDENYPHFEQIALSFVFQDEKPVSIQTALARMEQELSDAFS